MNRGIIVGLAFSICPLAVDAQQGIVGKYNGSLQRERGRTSGITIEITSAEDGKLKGSYTSHGAGVCGGIFPIEGTYQGNKLEFTAAKGGSTGDCLERKFEVVLDGNKLVGQMRQQTGEMGKVQLSK